MLSVKENSWFFFQFRVFIEVVFNQLMNHEVSVDVQNKASCLGFQGGLFASERLQ